jgi:hypothetical protein
MPPRESLALPHLFFAETGLERELAVRRPGGSQPM